MTEAPAFEYSRIHGVSLNEFRTVLVVLQTVLTERRRARRPPAAEANLRPTRPSLDPVQASAASLALVAGPEQQATPEELP